MATPIGHLMAGAAIGSFMSRGNNLPFTASMGALAAIAADFDFLPGLFLGAPSRFHHAQSHSITFALLAGILALIWARKARLFWGILIGLAYASHLALDLLTFDDSPPHGIPIFWPWLTEAFHCPVTLFPNVPWGNGLALSTHNINLLIRELGFLGPLFIGALLYASYRRRKIWEDLK